MYLSKDNHTPKIHYQIMILKKPRDARIEKTYLKYDLPDEFWLNEPNEDSGKMEYVQFLLNQRYADERRIADSMKNRTMFFLGSIGVSLTILLTVLSDWLVSFGSKNFIEQIWFSSICIALTCATICYIYIFYILTSMDYSERYPVNENAPYLLQKNSLKVTELQHYQNFRMYLRIRWLKQENILNQGRFKWGDFFYIIALSICFIGMMVSVPFSPVTVIFFVVISMFGYYFYMSYILMRDIHEIVTHIVLKKK